MSEQVREGDLSPRHIASLRIEREISEGTVAPSDCDCRLADGSYTRVYLRDGDPDYMLARIDGFWGRLKNPVLVLRPGERKPEPMPENKPRNLTEAKLQHDAAAKQAMAQQQASRLATQTQPVQENSWQRACRLDREAKLRAREEKYNTRGFRPQ